ncbi:uncharacterized protein [Drosophila pseudoobscura]|uniref:Uncharacterized protein isoform X1 n=1 Tax=Drosophila pseudoobscura pseudoobscura TaxID=46245 RepID=A0A6I8VQQ7_DROPS|nr:uncharacterized protein LOC26533467 isoform X1 [Drosophila pseudoobscura]
MCSWLDCAATGCPAAGHSHFRFTPTGNNVSNPCPIRTPPNQTLRFSFETQNLRVCTIRFATNRAVFDFPLPDGVLSNHYRGVFETDRGPYQQDRSAPLARSEPNKPSSSFDLAIDNKDFEYGNQGRG